MLVSQKNFLEENGLHLSAADEESIENDRSSRAVTPTLVVRYRHQRYVSIEADARTGRVKAFEASDGCSEGDGKSLFCPLMCVCIWTKSYSFFFYSKIKRIGRTIKQRSSKHCSSLIMA